MTMPKLSDLVKPWGYVVWLGSDGKWHAFEASSGQSSQSEVDYLLSRERAVEVWVVPAPSRYKAMRVAQKDWASRALGREVLHCQLCGRKTDKLYGMEIGRLLSLGISREKLGLGAFSFSSRRKAWLCKACLGQFGG